MSISVLHYTADGSFDGLMEYCDERVCLSVCLFVCLRDIEASGDEVKHTGRNGLLFVLLW